MAILYKKDWDKYPTAIADVHSANRSWVEMAFKLRAMGIDNWEWSLALIQPQLVGVDIWSKDLTLNQKIMILNECEWNPWYVLREVMRVPAKSGGGFNYLGANRGNLALFWCFFNSFMVYLQQIRQTGKSLNVRILVVAWHTFWARGAQHILFTKSDLRVEEIKEYKLIRSLIPEWMWEPHYKDSDNQTAFTTLSRGNTTKTYIPATDEEGANKVGRGTTPTLVTGDEGPFLKHARISIVALLSATGASFREAEAKGAMFGVVFTTTAGDLSTESGKYFYNKIKRQSMHFAEFLYDCANREEAIATILANGAKEEPRVDITFSHRQLGIEDSDLRKMIARSSGEVDQIKRDYMNQWTFGSAANPIPQDILDKIRKGINDSPLNDRNDKNQFIIRYHLPIAQVIARRAVLGMDTSNAIGRDAISGILTDVETGETLAAFTVSESNLSIFTMWLADLFELWPLMTLVPEAKSSWDGIRDRLLIELPNRGIDPGRRIYSRVVDDADNSEGDRRRYREYSQGHASERKYAPHRNQFGFPTSASLRDSMYGEIMREATKNAPGLIRDHMLVDELSSLVMKRGRIDHAASGHDDHVISWLMNQWFLRYARNYDHYGIPSQSVLSRLRHAALADDPKETSRMMKQEKIKRRVIELEARMENAKSAMEVAYYQTRVNSLRSELTEEDSSQIDSVDRASEKSREVRQSFAKEKYRNSSIAEQIRPAWMRR